MTIFANWASGKKLDINSNLIKNSNFENSEQKICYEHQKKLKVWWISLQSQILNFQNLQKTQWRLHQFFLKWLLWKNSSPMLKTHRRGSVQLLVLFYINLWRPLRCYIGRGVHRPPWTKCFLRLPIDIVMAKNGS